MSSSNTERIEYILKFVKGKTVVDIGGVDRPISNGDIWLHGRIAELASYIVGVDISEEGVKKAREAGYNFVVGNAERLQECTDRQFDVCVAGEVIEHLPNSGLFLDSVFKVLKPGGQVIITTPNAFALGNIIRILRYAFRQNPDDVHFEHKAWYCMTTLRQAIEAQGLIVDELFTVRPEHERPWVAKVKKFLAGNANARLVCLAHKP